MNEFNIDWDKPFKGAFSTQMVIGAYSPHPEIIFTIHRHACRWDSRLGQDVWETTYSVGYSIQGNSSSVVLKTKLEVTTYLDHQTALLPQYLILIGKRDKLNERIKPLNNKCFKYANQLHDLAKQQ